MPTPALPHMLPSTNAGKIDYLSTLMTLKPYTIAGISEPKACKILTTIVLYQHLDRLDK